MISNPSTNFSNDPDIAVDPTGLVFDNFWNNVSTRQRSFHFYMPPLKGKRYVFYFAAGPFERAKLFKP